METNYGSIRNYVQVVYLIPRFISSLQAVATVHVNSELVTWTNLYIWAIRENIFKVSQSDEKVILRSQVSGKGK